MNEGTFWEPTDEFLNQADYDLKLLVKSWKDEYGADDYACSIVLRTIADSIYLPEGQPLVAFCRFLCSFSEQDHYFENHVSDDGRTTVGFSLLHVKDKKMDTGCPRLLTKFSKP